MKRPASAAPTQPSSSGGGGVPRYNTVFSTGTHRPCGPPTGTFRSSGNWVRRLTVLARLCLRHDLLLLTTDRDFEPIARHVPLRLWQGS